MKVLFTADPHIDFLDRLTKAKTSWQRYVAKEKPDVVLVGGDLIQGGFPQQPSPRFMLDHPDTYFVLGNHDLWTQPAIGRKPLYPDEAMVQYLADQYRWGNALECSMDDCSTYFTQQGTAIVGTIGFPDFGHPRLQFSPEVCDRSTQTNDIQYMDLKYGWLWYTNRIKAAFSRRLLAACQAAARDVLVVTHYPIFESQAHGDGSLMSAYFYNAGLGHGILDAAQRYPALRFWCLAGHSHEFCRGIFSRERENVIAFGLPVEYGQLRAVVFDTDRDPHNQQIDAVHGK